jgi:bifunctional UDP-N-acetylglucosamine pyrophosphorylase/glucosamine-1-phosphate N-acetyltransferase
MESNPTENRPLDVLILAAGLGTRMRSNFAKVLHKADGRPLINHVCRTAAALSPQKIYIVIGHQGDEVRKAVHEQFGESDVVFVEQKQQLGTGDAVNSAREYLEGRDSTILILSGDVPLIRPETLSGLIQQHHTHKNTACTILTVNQGDPNGYGRVIRGPGGAFERIVEQKDASDAEREIQEINAGIYCFNTRRLFETLNYVKNENAQSEYYLTDAPALLNAAGDEVAIFLHSDPREIEGVNNRRQLADIERLIRERTISRLMLDDGVTFIDPETTYISEFANIGRDTVIYPNVSIEGSSEIGEGTTVRAGSRITNAKIGSHVEVLDNCVIVNAEIADKCTVGPFAHLRGKARMEEGSKVGNFVELKKTNLGKNSKASHLTYLGDATIGENTNIGAGTITCNYDGKNKHETHIGSNVKIGSDTMLVAPISVGDGASTGAGSVVTKDIEPGELVVGVPARSKAKKDTQSA